MQQTSKKNNETEFLKIARHSAVSRKIPVIDDATGRFLEAVCFIKKPRKILEIGCGSGYSTYFLIKHFYKVLHNRNIGRKKDNKNFLNNLADSIESIYENVSNVDTHNSNFKTTAIKSCVKKPVKCFSYTGIDLNRDRLSEAAQYITNTFPDYKNFLSLKIDFIHGNALKIIPGLKDSFDLVFIDAAKFEYPLYISAIEKNLKKGSIVIADNVYYSKKIFDEDIRSHDKNSVNGLRKYLEYIQSCSYFETELFDIADGISISIHK